MKLEDNGGNLSKQPQGANDRRLSLRSREGVDSMKE
jgi:hypothetical protein